MAPISELIGTRVKHLRQTKGLSQRELARHSGVSQPMLSQIERGDREPNLGTIKRISNAFGIPLDRLLEPTVRVDQGKQILKQQDDYIDLINKFSRLHTLTTDFVKQAAAQNDGIIATYEELLEQTGLLPRQIRRSMEATHKTVLDQATLAKINKGIELLVQICNLDEADYELIAAITARLSASSVDISLSGCTTERLPDGGDHATH